VSVGLAVGVVGCGIVGGRLRRVFGRGGDFSASGGSGLSGFLAGRRGIIEFVAGGLGHDCTKVV
jgi:hypothetical protein